GASSDLKVDASGGSDFHGYDLVTETCTVEASGGSDIDITVNKELSAEASGASDVSWKGSATVKKVKASGAGSVSHRS
ncbi:MAG: GIN domain-containing protein, partial [Flavisolibacter sp.]